jgi:F-type H+-transporting ATPase subunit b
MLPQFEISYFPSQIFWLFVSFGMLFCFIQFYFFPRMQKILEKRRIAIEKYAKTHEHNLNEIRVLNEKQNSILQAAKEEAEAHLKKIESETKEFAEKRCREIDISLNGKFEEAREKTEQQISNYVKTLKEEVLKSSIHVLAKLEESPIDLEKVKKYVS